jgi:hypothetical protein
MVPSSASPASVWIQLSGRAAINPVMDPENTRQQVKTPAAMAASQRFPASGWASGLWQIAAVMAAIQME